MAELPLDRKGVKEGQSLLKGVRKFLRYNDDLIADEKKDGIEQKRTAFETALKNREAKRKELETLAEDLTETCKKSVKDYKTSAWKENVEVVFVAVVIAMGIRAYFIQQFKIPTGSMQPTLNGIIAYPTQEMNPNSEYSAPNDYEKPALPKRLWDKFWYGRTHVEWIVEEDDVLVLNDSNIYTKNHLIFFPRTYLVTQNGKKFSAPGTRSRIMGLLNTQLFRSPGFSKIIQVQRGQTIAEGFVDTGDQLVVNKFAYHWVTPSRDDVFVFNTQGIPKIQAGLDDPRQGSQHYIKRLVGEPGDTLEIKPPELWVNGEIGQGPGMRRVMSQEGRFSGYTLMGTRSTTLPEKKYWAMGDNSKSSSDSRDWGTVPQEDIVGRAAFVYYPFGHHFGKVK